MPRTWPLNFVPKDVCPVLKCLFVSMMALQVFAVLCLAWPAWVQCIQCILKPQPSKVGLLDSIAQARHSLWRGSWQNLHLPTVSISWAHGHHRLLYLLTETEILSCHILVLWEPEGRAILGWNLLNQSNKGFSNQVILDILFTFPKLVLNQCDAFTEGGL